MTQYQCVYCMFCVTGKERQIVRRINENGLGQAIFPQRIKTIRNATSNKEILYALMPGYVFVYSRQNEVAPSIYSGINHVIRVLSYENGKYELTGRDLEFAHWLWQLGGKVGILKAAKVGDRIEIIDGVFKKLNGIITKMDKRRKTIQISLETKGSLRHVWLAYEIVENRA